MDPESKQGQWSRKRYELRKRRRLAMEAAIGEVWS